MRLDRDLTCAEIVELVTEYLEGGLSTEERERFEEHIAFCDWCLTYLDQMRETIAATGRVQLETLPAELEVRLLEAFREWTTA